MSEQIRIVNHTQSDILLRMINEEKKKNQFNYCSLFQKLSDNSEPTTSKRSKHSDKQNKRSNRIKNQKPLRYNISSESDEHNDTDNNDNDDSVSIFTINTMRSFLNTNRIQTHTHETNGECESPNKSNPIEAQVV